MSATSLVRVGGAYVDPDEVLLDLDRVEARESLSDFIQMAWHIIEPGQPYVHGWHIDAICEHLEAITDGVEVNDEVYNRLLINIPPGTMKSLAVSVFWPAWEWGPCNMPHLRYVCASHSQDLAIRDTTRMRRLIMSDWYQARWPHVKMTNDQNQKTKFENTSGGFRQAVAAGSITGARGDRVICLPYESLILSDIGWLPIGEIVERQLDVKIAGAGIHGIEWQPIEAYERNPARPILRVECDGAFLECTDDHRVFVRGRGWIAASDIVPGDCVFLADDAKLRELREAHSSQKESNEVLRQAVLHGFSQEDCGDNQHHALLGVCEAGVSASSASQARKQVVLLDGMCGGREKRRIQPELVRWAGSNDVPSMRGKVYAQTIGVQESEVVLSNMCIPVSVGQAGGKINSTSMHGVREVFPTQEPQRQDVLIGMRGYGALQEDEGGRERKVCSRQRREAVSAGMDAHVQGANKTTRWDEVYDMQPSCVVIGYGTACSSHRLRQEQHITSKPDNTLQVVPRQDAWEFGESCGLVPSIVRSVMPTGRVVEHTYNVRVAPCHNYFAEGILVHNCDDPHSVESAASEQQRASTIEWFTEAVPTRLNNPRESAIVVVMQRLHEEDVSGIILERQLGYDHLMLPMEFDPSRAYPTKIGFTDPRTETGELLFPERFPPDVVARDKRIMGPYATAGQFQQEPTPRGGGVIRREWWKLFEADVFPPMEYVVASLDTAYTTKAENDFSALTVWGLFSGAQAQQIDAYGARDGTQGARSRRDRQDAMNMFDEAAQVFHRGPPGPRGDQPRLMLMDGWQERLELHALVERVAATCRRLKVDLLLIENKAAGHSVAQEIRRLYSHENWAVQMYDPKTLDKLARLYSIQHLFAEGIIYAPDRAFAEMVIQQVSVFPKGKNDDLVDTVSMAVKHYRDRGLLVREPEWQAEMQDAMRHQSPVAQSIYEV